MARQVVSGAPVTFRLRSELFPIVRAGAVIQGVLTGRALANPRIAAPSIAQWLRSMIRFSYEFKATISEAQQKSAMHAPPGQAEEMVKVRTLLPEALRITLRKYECEVQALDWAVEFDRNAAVNHLIHLYGASFNDYLCSADVTDEATLHLITP